MKEKIVLIPVDGTALGLEAVRRVARDERASVLRVELLNVQPLLHHNVSRWVSRPVRDAWRAERSSHALEPARRMLVEAGVPCALNAATGSVPERIAEFAKRLRVDEVLLASRRHTPLARLFALSVSDRLLRLSPVPVRIVPSAQPAGLGRLAVPAGVGLGLAAWLVATGD